MQVNPFHTYPLSEEIVRALDHLGYTEPTPVQSKVIPEVLAHRDLTVRSQTGSGKTAAFGIPICELVEWEENRPQALVLTPTRELAGQVKEDLINIGRFKRIKAVAIYGKQPFAQQKLELQQKVHIVAGTPGRVLDHIKRGTLDVDRLRYLVIDEADEMLNRGFIEQVESIIKELPKDRVTLLFSATLPPDVEQLCHRHMKDPVDIEIETAGITTDRIAHTLYIVKDERKQELLKAVTTIQNPDSCMIFCRTQEAVDQVSRILRQSGYPCDKIHGGMEQNDRFSVMHAFRRREFRYLVATDLAARGIDIENITHVINYDLPMDKENFVHRTGRTGRAGQSGIAITFATPSEGRYLDDIQGYIGFELPRADPPSAAQVAQAKEAFEEKLSAMDAPRLDKCELLSQDITKLYFGGGKKKKLRTVDFVGTIAKLEGMTAADIGIITIEDSATFVEILNGKGSLVLRAMKNTTVKGKVLKVHIANK